jgi:hypothetical protein
MSLYNMLFGVQSTADAALAMLGITEGAVPRFRDAYFSLSAGGEPRITIHTRTGGGNRDYYESAEACRDNYPKYFGRDDEADPSGPWNADLRELPGFLYDSDDGFDCTYADFHYAVPEVHRQAVADFLKDNGAPATPAEKWRSLLTALRAMKKETPND